MAEPIFPVDILSPSKDAGARALVALRGSEPRADVPPEALVGTVVMRGNEPDWDSFQLMDRFRAIFVSFMRGELDPEPSILGKARVHAGGYVYVIDGRVADPMGDVPFHEIIGWYTSDASGRPVAASFEYNDEHQIISDRGFSSMLADPIYRRWAFRES